MAKTMMEKVEAHFSKEFYEGSWRFRGTQFLRMTSYGTRDLFVLVHFSCGYGWVKAKVFADDYGIPESVRMFAGDTAAEDCIRWAASKAVEVFETVSARTEPYKDGMMKYKMALQGGSV